MTYVVNMTSVLSYRETDLTQDQMFDLSKCSSRRVYFD